MYKKTIKKLDHFLYDSEKEFRQYQKGVKLVRNWKDGKAGDWVLSDDGQVCQVLADFQLGGRNYVRTLLGTHNTLSDERLEGEPRKNIYSFAKDEYPFVSRKIRDHLTNADILFAKYIAAGVPKEEAYRKAFPRARSDAYIKDAVTFLLKSERIQKRVTHEIKELMDDLEVSEEWLIKHAKSIVEELKATDRMRALEWLGKLRGLPETDTKRSTLVAIAEGFTREQLEQYTQKPKEIPVEAEVVKKDEKTDS